MDNTPYRELAARLDELPKGFPPTEDALSCACWPGSSRPEEAALAARLRLTLETPAEIAARAWAAIRRRCAGSSRRWPSAG